MCRDCWEEYGSPKLYNANVKRASDLAKSVYASGLLTGGALHIVLDDFNVEDECVDFCAKYLEDNRSDYGDTYELQKECIQAFKILTEDERASALAVHDGYFDLAELN